VKDQINGDITALNEAITTEDQDKIREALERLKTSSMEIGKAIYSQADGAGDQSSNEQAQEEPAAEDKKDEEQKDGEEKEKKDEEKK